MKDEPFETHFVSPHRKLIYEDNLFNKFSIKLDDVFVYAVLF